MPDFETVVIEEPSQQEVLDHVVVAALHGQELYINGHHLYAHQVQVIADMVAHLWPEWHQRIIDMDRWHRGL